MNQKRVYKSYPREFKKETLALVTEQGYSVAKAAESLGIRTNQHYYWKARIKDEVLSGGERAELKQLQKESKNLRIEKEILLGKALKAHLRC